MSTPQPASSGYPAPAQPPAPVAPAAPKTGRGLIWTGAILLVLSVISGIIAVVGAVGGAANVVDTVSVPDGGQATITVDEDSEYYVYSDAGWDHVGCTVQDEDGSGVNAYGLSSSTSITVNGLDAFGGFTAHSSGDYTVTCFSDTGSARFAVGAGSTAIVGTAIVGVLFGILAFLFFALGLVLLIIGLVRRSGAKKNAALAGAPMAPGAPMMAPGAAMPGAPMPAPGAPAPMPAPGAPTAMPAPGAPAPQPVPPAPTTEVPQAPITEVPQAPTGDVPPAPPAGGDVPPAPPVDGTEPRP